VKALHTNRHAERSRSISIASLLGYQGFYRSIMRHNDLPERWKAKLQDYLIQKGSRYKTLGASDFPIDTVIQIHFEDDSKAEFKYAFVLEAPDFAEIGLFTEHCGYHIFQAGSLEISIKNIE
jgi:hypothetical protein